MPKVHDSGSRSAFRNPPWWVGWIVGYFVLIPFALLVFDLVAAVAVTIAWTIAAPTYVRTMVRRAQDPERVEQVEDLKARRKQRDRL